MEQLLSPKTLASRLGLAQQTIYNRHSTGGDLPKAIKLGHRLRFHPVDVESWLEAKRLSAAVATPHPAPGQSFSGGRRGPPSVADQFMTELSQ
ncbi:helix-turn-helix transcriptional regulator [Ralstonia mannitolilytica]|uniref:helix-turn-helix transcriptional regulator n=1 Tax=Ralstonia mannitolilytica TaxID=105219 RepID=UPI002931F053|nr:helix-turn-helix domain-containing protein [Ralstonia mannitolilytica]